MDDPVTSENGTIGILGSTAVEGNLGGKNLKPAGKAVLVMNKVIGGGVIC